MCFFRCERIQNLRLITGCSLKALHHLASPTDERFNTTDTAEQGGKYDSATKCSLTVAVLANLGILFTFPHVLLRKLARSAESLASGTNLHPPPYYFDGLYLFGLKS